MNEFYNLMKTQQYRKAEAMIADDTQEYYYAGAKPVIHSFELLDLQYSDNFTKARAMTKTSQPLVMAGFPADRDRGHHADVVEAGKRALDADQRPGQDDEPGRDSKQGAGGNRSRAPGSRRGGRFTGRHPQGDSYRS